MTRASGRLHTKGRTTKPINARRGPADVTASCKRHPRLSTFPVLAIASPGATEGARPQRKGMTLELVSAMMALLMPLRSAPHRWRAWIITLLPAKESNSHKA